MQTERVSDVTLQNTRVTIDKETHQLLSSHVSTYEIIHNLLAFHEVSCRWGPEYLTEVYKEKSVYVLKRFLDLYGAEDDHFLKIIFKGDGI